MEPARCGAGRANEMLTLSPTTPHNPIRSAFIVRVVLEHLRLEDSLEHLRWYLQVYSTIVHKLSSIAQILGRQLRWL